MKRVFLFMIVGCFLAINGFAQTEEKEENPNAPVMTFDSLVHDFGTVPLNGLAEWEFVFTNSGKEPLIVQRCSASCTCTVPECPKDKPVLPGEKVTIKVKFTNTHTLGSFNKQFMVISNAQNSPVRLTIKGMVEDKEKP